jgi:hypothetical protein
MKNVLFIPVNSIQAELFIRIAKQLLNTNIQIKFFSLDKIYAKRYPNYLVEPILKREGFEYSQIENIGQKYLEKTLFKVNPCLIVNSQDAMEPILKQLMDIAEKNSIPGLVIQDAFMFWLKPPYCPVEQERANTAFEKLNAITQDARCIFSIVSYGDNVSIRFQRIVGRLREILRGESTRWGDGVYSKIAVMGEYTKRMLVARNIPVSKIIITGQPRWDDFNQNFMPVDRSALCKKFGLDPNKKIILLTTQPLVESRMWSVQDREFYLISIGEIISENSEYSLIIKIHPRERKQIYEDILMSTKLIDKCKLFSNENIHELLLCCDVLITHVCTTALEAMLLKKPVISVDFKVSTKNIPYVEAGASIGIDAPSQLAESVHRVLYDPVYRLSFNEHRDKFVYDCAFLQDGKSTERLVQLIVSMTNTKDLNEAQR